MKNKEQRLFVNTKLIKCIDWWLIGIVLAIVVFSIISIVSVTSTGFSEDELTFWEFVETLDFSYAKLQLIFFGVGIAIAAAVMFVDYNNLRDFTDLLYVVVIALLILVLIFGKEINGTKGWFKFGSRSFQPAEIGKVAMIIIFAKQFAKVTERTKHGISTIKELFPLLWRFLIPFALILLQPDFGTSIVYLFIFAMMLFAARTSWKLIGLLVLGAGVAAPIAWFSFSPYQKDRVLNFFDPSRDIEGSGMNVARAKSVIQSGGVPGKGFFSPQLLTQSGSYLPEDHTDFIFSATSEAVGFWGGMLLLLLYFLLLGRMVMLAMRAKDDFGCYIILGVVFMMFFHIFINIGMNIGAMPVTGIPLPFFSYGGSYLLTSMLAVGVVLNVNMRRIRYTV